METRDTYLIEVKTVTKGTEKVDKATGKVKKLDQATKDLQNSQKAQADLQNQAMGKLDQMTGGAISQFKKVKQGIQATLPALKGMKGAIIATGIGALVVAVGVLVANWESVANWAGQASKESRDQLASAEAMVKATEDQLSNISATENILKLQGKTEEDILKMKMAATDEAIAAKALELEAIKRQKDEQVKIAERNKAIAQGIIRFLTIPITTLLTAVDQLTAGLAYVGVLEEGTNFEEAFSGGLANLLFDPEEVATEGDKAIQEAEKALQTLQNTRAGYTLQQQAQEQADAQKAQEQKDQADADELAKAEAKAKAMADIERAVWEQSATNIEKEVRAVEDKYNALVAMAEEHGLSTVEIEQAREDAITAIEEQARLDREAANAKANQERIDADNLANEKIIENRHKLINSIGSVMMEGAKFALALVQSAESADEQSARRRFETAKKIQLGAAVMSTAQAVIAALAAPPVGLGFPAGIPGAAQAALAGAASIATIKRQQFQSAGTGGTGGRIGGQLAQVGSQAPTIDLSFMNQGSQDVEPVRAYVLEQQVTSSQQSNQLIQQQAQL
jgi:hypothetical protein